MNLKHKTKDECSHEHFPNSSSSNKKLKQTRIEHFFNENISKQNSITQIQNENKEALEITKSYAYDEAISKHLHILSFTGHTRFNIKKSTKLSQLEEFINGFLDKNLRITKKRFLTFQIITHMNNYIKTIFLHLYSGFYNFNISINILNNKKQTYIFYYKNNIILDE